MSTSASHARFIAWLRTQAAPLCKDRATAPPEVIDLIFKRGQRRGAKAGGQFKTHIVTYGTEVNVNAFYRHSRIKQYLTNGRALRIETVINDPDDVGCRRQLCHLDELQARAPAINTTLLDTVGGSGCVFASPAL
jgi:hypothetical protein